MFVDDIGCETRKIEIKSIVIIPEIQ